MPGKLGICDVLRLTATEGNIARRRFEARCSIQLSYGRGAASLAESAGELRLGDESVAGGRLIRRQVPRYAPAAAVALDRA